MQIVVIGAGVIGAAVAHALAARGASVDVIDMRAPGAGASQASAGILAPFTEAHQGSPLLALGRRSLLMFDNFIAAVEERSGRAVEYARTGTLEVALDVDDRERLLASRAWLQADGVPVEWLEPAALRTFEPTIASAASGGLFVPHHGFVSVPSLVTALVQAARFSGATLEAPVEAVAVTHDRHGAEVVAGTRHWRADTVVVAGGAWSGRVRIAGAEPVPVRPIRGQLLHLRWTDRDRPGRVVWGPGCYAVPWADGSLLVGATVEDAGFDESSTLSGVAGLSASVASLLPAAAGAALDGVRVGLRPATPDRLPLVGPLPVSPRVVVASGHFRNGILLAPLTADLVSRLVLDGERDPALAITDPARFVR